MATKAANRGNAALIITTTCLASGITIAFCLASNPPEWAYKVAQQEAIQKLDANILRTVQQSDQACEPQREGFTPFRELSQNTIEGLNQMTSRDSYPVHWIHSYTNNQVSAATMNGFLDTLNDKGIVYAGKRPVTGNDKAGYYKINAIYYNGSADRPDAKTLVVNDFLMGRFDYERILPLIENEALSKNLKPGETVVILSRGFNNVSVHHLPPGQMTTTDPSARWPVTVPPNPCLKR